MRKFTGQDIGCYADGCYGHDHIRVTLAQMLLDFGGCKHTHASLSGEMPDDAWDECDAIDWLNEMVCEGCYFDMVDGDLILMDESAEVE